MTIMQTFRKTIIVAGFTLGAFLPNFAAAGAVLDLSGFSAGSQYGDGLLIPSAGSSGVTATLDNYFDRNIVFFDSNYVTPSRVFCFLQQFGCGMTGAMYFSTAVQDITFDVEQTSTLSNIRADAYNDGNLLGSLFWNDLAVGSNIGPTRRFDFSGFGPVTALVLNSQGDHAFYGNFAFQEVTSSVTEPSAAVLCLLGLVGLGLRRQRHQILA